MDPQWQKIDALFQKALQMPGTKRGSFLADSIHETAIIDEVLSLLRYHDMAEEEAFLSEAVFPREGDQRYSKGVQIGRYTLHRRLGEGGMGMVWRAEQKEPVVRTVALKILKPGLDSSQIMARFDNERRFLARLNHPYIAQIFDAGMTEFGHPYFVMEYLSGLPLNRYCDLHRYDFDQRLDLFLKVCEGIRHAHQKGAVHRDLKPGNILVVEQGDMVTPKIFDFGIAKAVHDEADRGLTQAGTALGSPGYMSPEQCDSRIPVDQRTDIYSLGVILYQLLCGRLPLPLEDLRNLNLAELIERIHEHQPISPSQHYAHDDEDTWARTAFFQTDRKCLYQRLKGDLDWIIEKAMAKEKAMRYDTVAKLEEDLIRFRHGLPIHAKPGNAYRLGKQLQRNRLPLTAALLVLLFAVVVFLAKRTQVVPDQKIDTPSVQFMEQFLAAMEHGDGQPSDDLLKALDEAVAELDSFKNGDTLSVATLAHGYGLAYLKLGETEKAEAMLGRAFRTRADLLGNDHGETRRSYFQLGLIHSQKGEFEKAESVFSELLHNSSKGNGPSRESIRNALAVCMAAQGKMEEASQYLVTEGNP